MILKCDVMILKCDVMILKCDVMILKCDIAILKCDMILKYDVMILKCDIMIQQKTIFSGISATKIFFDSLIILGPSHGCLCCSLESFSFKDFHIMQC